MLTNKLCMIYCELPKLPKAAGFDGTLDIENSSNDEIMKMWLSLFSAKTEKDLSDIEGLGVDVLSKAVAAYRKVTASDRFKELERIREKARHDEASVVYNAEMRGEAKGVETEREKWQEVVAEKDKEIAILKAMVSGNRA